MKRRILFAVAALLLPVTALAAKPLVHAIPADIASLDPADIRGQQDQEIGVNVYERLVKMKFNPKPDGTLMADPVEVVPELAESWTVDGPVITFKLRPGVKFYPTGNPMTAEDVRYSFERLTRIVGNGKNQAGIAGLFKAEQVEVVDPMTVKITFTDGSGVPTAIPVALTSMKFQQFAVIDSVEVKKHLTAEDPWANEWLKKNLATTGPYYIANRQLGQQLELKAVPNHWSGKQPPFEDVVLRITGNADLVSLIKGGVVDYAAEGLTGRQYDALQAAGFPVLHGETPSIMRLHMAMDKEPFTDARVRQAMLYGIPHDRIVKTALAGRGKRQICLWNADDWTCNNSYEKYKYDPAKAKALLKEAGKEKFSFDFWYSTALPYNSDIAIIIADSLKSIGVTANLKPTPALQLLDAYRARINGVDQNMSGMYLNEFVIWLNDPSTLANLAMVTKSAQGGISNWARFSDPAVDEAHYKYRNSSDREARLAAYRMIQDKAAEAAGPINPIILVGRTIVVNPRIGGVTFSQDPYVRYVYFIRNDEGRAHVTEIAAIKRAACEAIDAASATLFDISAKMHAETELSFEEVKAQAWQCGALRAAGFQVEEGLGSLKTAFRGTVASGKPGPRIAFLCEYDGLPVYGQSCGHNVVAAAGVGAAIGLARAIGEIGGTAIALGTPGEEGGGGKNIMHREGFFEGIDAMMLVYPGFDNIAHSRSLCVTRVQVDYYGKAAHAAARPELGINALDALLLAINGISALRQQLPSDVRVHTIITKGGTLPQVIPDHTTAILTVRANNPETFSAVIPRIDACLQGGAMMTGARLERAWRDKPGRELLSNFAMAESFERNLRALGRTTRSRDELSGAWSGDTGNVSWHVPTIQPQMAMTPRDVPPHSHEFHAASIGAAAEACILDSAKAMAMTAIDLVTDPTLLQKVRAEFAAA